jgi:hypothetical protein
MRVTTVTCDRCKKVILEKDYSQIWPVKVVYGSSSSVHTQVEWCRSCTIEMGLLTVKAEKTIAPRIEPPPTIEDLIREIAYEVAQEEIGRSR